MVAQNKIGKAEAFGQEEISFAMSCPTCRGTGTATQRIAFETLERVYAKCPDNKINRIKEVRALWGLGLRTAKELVETYDKYVDGVRTLERKMALSMDEASAKLLTELTEIDYS